MLCIPDIICSRKGNSFESKMHWLLWLSLTEAEPNNISRLKHLSCLFYGHTPLQTPSFDFKTWTKAADKQGFIMVTVTATNHTSYVKFWDVQVRGEAVLMKPGCQAHLCFYSKANSEEGARMSRASVMGMRALDQPWEPFSHEKRHPSPLLQQEAMPFPCLLSSSTATTRTGTCSMGSWAASCGLGQKPSCLAWREGWSDRDMGQSAPSILGTKQEN